MSADPFAVDASLARWQRWSLITGVAATLVCLVGAFLGGAGNFYRAWLPAYVFWLGIGLGGMAILMIYHLTGGAWGFLIRRILEAQTKTLPLLAVLFLPIAFGVGSLYRWADAAVVEHDAHIARQQFYLNPPFFWVRSAIYFVLWLVLAWFLIAWSRRQDETGDARLPWRFQRFSEAGLVLFGTSMHFAAFDWVQMLTPTFHSTVFPMLVVSGQVVSALAFAIVVFRTTSIGLETSDVLSLRVFNDLGNLLLAFLVVWAYLLWFQFMLVWMANLPYGVEWHLPRMLGFWRWVTLAVVFLHFVAPFFLLLFRAVKCRRATLARVAALILGMHLVYDFALVTPSFAISDFSSHWMAFLTPVAIGGLWLATFFRALRGEALLVRNDPNRVRAEHVRKLDLEDIEREEALAHG